MDGERPLDPDAERLLADGERLACARALPLDHDPFEDLHAPARALDHLKMHADGVARLEAGNVLARWRCSMLSMIVLMAKGDPEGRGGMLAD